MTSIWFVVLGTMLYAGVDVRLNVYCEQIVVENGDCSRNFVINIGSYSYFLDNTVELCFLPSNLMFDAHDNLLAIFEDKNGGISYKNKPYIKGKQLNEFQLIKGLNNTQGAQGLAYDHRSKNNYFATEDGVYVYVPNLSSSSELTSYAFDGEDIMDIDFDKDGNPYIARFTFGGLDNIYTVDKWNETMEFPKIPRATYFKIDNDGNFYFILDNYFYVLWADESTPQKISSVLSTKDKAIAFDEEGNGYLAHGYGLLFLERGTKKFVRVVGVYGAFISVAIDSKGNLALGEKQKVAMFTKIGRC